MYCSTAKIRVPDFYFRLSTFTHARQYFAPTRSATALHDLSFNQQQFFLIRGDCINTHINDHQHLFMSTLYDGE
jgi:hypothetical protein